MKALTVKQPHASLLFAEHPGFYKPRSIKIYETRTRRTHYRGELLITTSLKPDKNYRPLIELIGICRVCGCTNDRACRGGCSWANDSFDLCDKCVEQDQQYGMAIGVVDLVDCFPFEAKHVMDAACELYDGFCWKFENPRKITPVPIKGNLGIWNADFILYDTLILNKC